MDGGIGGGSSTHRRDEKLVQNLVEHFEGRAPLGNLDVDGGILMKSYVEDTGCFSVV
jgi:hypothetical protein